MRNIGVGVIGTGFMGKAHSFAYRAVAGIFPASLRPVLQSVAVINVEASEQAAKQFGFHRWRTDWRALVEDPDIEVVSITTPNVVHREMALAAVAAGKHVHCEKPIAPNADAAKDMMDAAEAAGVVTQVGYNYIKNPMLKLARSMVAAGELGEITAFRGIHAEDYMADPETPYNWRVDASGGAGAIADIGSHIIGVAHLRPLGPGGARGWSCGTRSRRCSDRAGAGSCGSGTPGRNPTRSNRSPPGGSGACAAGPHLAGDCRPES